MEASSVIKLNVQKVIQFTVKRKTIQGKNDIFLCTNLLKNSQSRKCVRQPCNEGDCQLRPKYLLFKTLKLTEDKQNLSKEILLNVIRTKSFKFYVDFKINLAIKAKGFGVKKAELSDFG